VTKREIFYRTRKILGTWRVYPDDQRRREVFELFPPDCHHCSGLLFCMTYLHKIETDGRHRRSIENVLIVGIVGSPPSPCEPPAHAHAELSGCELCLGPLSAFCEWCLGPTITFVDSRRPPIQHFLWNSMLLQHRVPPATRSLPGDSAISKSGQSREKSPKNGP